MKTGKKRKNSVKSMENTSIKAYNMVKVDENTAEIDMYGDVYMDIPRDWWSGKEIEGQYISAEEFLNDLEDLKDKERITVHINSGGGDLYAGLAIYNRLKSLDAEIVTVNDGLAASAASLIFQAGDIRQMNAASNFMAHGASGFLFGSYTVDDLETLVDRFKAHNKAVYAVYAERMGTSLEEAEQFVQGETWLTGQEAVDQGLADEVIGDDLEEDDIKDHEDMRAALRSTCSQIIDTLKEVYPDVVGVRKDLENASQGQGKTLKCLQPYPVSELTFNRCNCEIGNRVKKEEEPLIENVKDLEKAYPDMVKEIENQAKAEAVTAERNRIKEIEQIEPTISDKTLVHTAKFTNGLSAQELAFEAMKAQAKAGEELIGQMQDDAQASGANAVQAVPAVDPMNSDSPENQEAKKAEIEDYIQMAAELDRR